MEGTTTVSIKPARALTPEDLLADGAEGTEIGGIYVRKGTVASFIQNVKALQNLAAGSADFDAVVDQLRAVQPALEALEIFDVFEVRDPRIVELLASPAP
jgi:hypothetical protein